MSSSTDATINTPTSCANCSKNEAIDCKLKSCMACKLVKYCSEECQVSHRPQHKKACKKRAAELHEEKLFEDHPEREECSICMLLLPTDPSQSVFQSCCGQTICMGCRIAQYREEFRSGKDRRDIGVCAFCRMPEYKTKKEHIDRLKRCMEKKNARAFSLFSGYCYEGKMGLPIDEIKARALFLEAGELGCSDGYFNLGIAYGKVGLEQDLKKEKYYYELAAMGGNCDARCNLGCLELKAHNIERAYKHFIIGARAGDERCLTMVTEGYKCGRDITKDEYTEVLRAYQKQHEETKSPARDEAIKFANNPSQYGIPKISVILPLGSTQNN